MSEKATELEGMRKHSQTVPERFLEVVVDHLIRVEEALLSGKQLRDGALLQHARLADRFRANENNPKQSLHKYGGSAHTHHSRRRYFSKK